jgi:hypothetical protein
MSITALLLQEPVSLSGICVRWRLRGSGRSLLGGPLRDLVEGFPLAFRVLGILLESTVWRVVEGAVAVLVRIIAVEEVGIFGLRAQGGRWLALSCLVFDRSGCGGPCIRGVGSGVTYIVGVTASEAKAGGADAHFGLLERVGMWVGMSGRMA